MNSSERIGDRHSGMARVPSLHVARRREIRRLVAKAETTLRIVLVKEVPNPDLCAPAIRRVAHLDMREYACRGALFVRTTEVEVIHSREIDACEESIGRPPLCTKIELVLRRVGLFASVEIRARGVGVVEEPRFEQRGPQIDEE